MIYQIIHYINALRKILKINIFLRLLQFKLVKQ